MIILKRFKSYILFLLSLIINNYYIYAVNLSSVKEIRKLSNYSEIINIEVERIIFREDSKAMRKNGVVYINNEINPFTGVIVGRTYRNNISSIYFYRNGKNNGLGIEYYKNGVPDSKKIYKDDIPIMIIDYYQNGKIKQKFNSNNEGRGVLTLLYPETDNISAKISVKLNFEIKGQVKYINHGETTVYEKNGKTWGILNYKDNKMYGLPQKLFKNGQLKYEYVASSEKGGSDFEAMKYFKEYFDNSDRLKLDCDEQSKGRWHCKEYSKNGQLKNEFASPTFALQIKRDNSYWTNVFLGIWNILIP